MGRGLTDLDKKKVLSILLIALMLFSTLTLMASYLAQ